MFAYILIIMSILALGFYIAPFFKVDPLVIVLGLVVHSFTVTALVTPYSILSSNLAIVHSGFMNINGAKEQLYDLELTLDTVNTDYKQLQFVSNHDNPIATMIKSRLDIKDRIFRQESKIGKACVEITSTRLGPMSGIYHMVSSEAKDLYKDTCKRGINTVKPERITKKQVASDGV